MPKKPHVSRGMFVLNRNFTLIKVADLDDLGPWDVFTLSQRGRHVSGNYWLYGGDPKTLVLSEPFVEIGQCAARNMHSFSSEELVYQCQVAFAGEGVTLEDSKVGWRMARDRELVSKLMMGPLDESFNYIDLGWNQAEVCTHVAQMRGCQSYLTVTLDYIPEPSARSSRWILAQLKQFDMLSGACWIPLCHYQDNDKYVFRYYSYLELLDNFREAMAGNTIISPKFDE